MTGPAPDTKGQPGISQAALFALCPRCGSQGLFAGLTRFAPRCKSCGLDYASFNVGDGPAAFLTMVIGALVVGLALWVQLAFEPPLWVHLVLWAPLIFGATIWGLRVSKAALLAAEFQRNAVEATGKDLRGDAATDTGQSGD
ncbi:DUF983 domain-containing protein [Novosphingobium sp.]|uniref:DUF983 domain-containing protein n=1 Tax=Novosphingobium sp. TaxID=1874826 RepID=UPI0025E60F39|nr:DUF983 domain-containing protein [Novosphingobium sp.]MCC6924496.1 DUF983 domain-containing protein [Novosphingobium sp.]